MSDQFDERYSWVVIEPSPRHSVRYLRSPIAVAAAKHLSCGKYLAVILEPSEDTAWLAVAYLVQPAYLPLPDTYLPISPCRMGPRDPLVPDFDWSFEECVINTGTIFVFRPVRVKSDGDAAQYSLSDESARRFSAVCCSDRDAQLAAGQKRRIASRKAAREADGFPDDVSQWTSFSVKSTYVPAPPGEFFPPSDILARLSYNIRTLENVLPASQCFEDKKDIQRLRARFSRPATERTIIWNMDQALSESPDPPVEEPMSDLPPAVIEFSASLDRPHSPDRPEEVVQASLSPEEFYALQKDDYVWGMGDLRITSHKKALRPPPLFDPPALQIMYFDIYGTLIDNESGIFDALQPLLVRCPHRFERREALTFYFESEIEMKQRMPAAPYSEILTQAYTDMASRLGHPTTEDEASSFASSIFEWPLFDGAVWCLQILKPWIPVLVGLFDVDFETVLKTPSFATLAPLFAEIFTRDASHAYRPDPMAFEPPFKYHDDLGIRREQRCLVSNGLLRDLEPAREQGIPAIWMCFPESLAGRVPSLERSVPWDVCTDFPHLVFAVLSETGALPLPPSADRAISPIV